MITAIADEKIGRWVKNPTIVQNAPRHCERMRDPETEPHAVSRYTPIGCKSWSSEARSNFALSALTKAAADPPAEPERPAISRATDRSMALSFAGSTRSAVMTACVSGSLSNSQRVGSSWILVVGTMLLSSVRAAMALTISQLGVTSK
jgi:hypothetical protein